MNTDWCDESKVFGPDFELPEHVPLEALDSPLIGVWLVGTRWPEMDADNWDYADLQMYGVTKYGRVFNFEWSISINEVHALGLADLL